MVGVVVYLPFCIANLWLHAPYVRVLTALSVAEDAWSVSVSDASHSSCELCGMVGEKEVAAVSSESLQSVDSLVRCQSAGEIGPSVSKTDAVAGSERIYNAAGQQYSAIPQKGLYILKGKKYVAN